MLEVETTGLSNSLDVGGKQKEEPRNHIFYGLCQVLPSHETVSSHSNLLLSLLLVQQLLFSSWHVQGMVLSAYDTLMNEDP